VALASQHLRFVTQFHIFAGDALIGRSFPLRFDRAGCTVIGPFVPTAEYDPEIHATGINGETKPLTSRSSLKVHGPEHVLVPTLDVCIYDMRSSSGRATRDVYIIGIPLELFDAYARARK
jgi:hypothetical protein